MHRTNSSPQFPQLKNEISDYKESMFEWWDSIDESKIGEWTFLLCLACWGVSDEVFKLIAFTIALLFFSERFVMIAKASTFTTKKESELFKKIRAARVSDNEFYELIMQLKSVIRNRSLFKSCLVIKRTWEFILSYAFLFFSFWYVIETYFKQ
ncbi:hypothetical protein [Providencia sneebia]|nr:hypothetical protein [Providencia sneebia]